MNWNAWGMVALGLIAVVAVGIGVVGHIRRKRAVRLAGFGLAAGCLVGVGVWAFLTLDEPAPHAPATLAASTPWTLPVGTPAPDFILPEVGTDKTVHLAELVKRKPVVLLLGSFGCDYMCYRLDSVRSLYDRYHDRAEFLFVYIDNDHKDPEWMQKVVADPTAAADAPVNRHARIQEGMKKYHLTLPCVDDTEADLVVKEYRASPAKLVIIDQDGKVAFDSGTVTRSGLSPEQAAEWLDEHTRANASSADDIHIRP